MSASVRDQMPKPSCVSCQLGSPTTTRFTRTRLSDIVHPVSSSQLTQDPDRVRSFGGYNSCLNKTASASLGVDRRYSSHPTACHLHEVLVYPPKSVRCILWMKLSWARCPSQWQTT